jgi:ribonucleoside-diphosphate reductase beta chain
MAELSLHDPQTLYVQWERGQWSPFDVDLSVDREDWARMDAGDRALVLWALASLMVAEERITTQFTGLVLAHDSEEEATFLATQQVDEARHMQFYKRFQDEVIADPATIAEHVERSRAQLSDAFRRIFDDALVEAHRRLAASPRDRAAKVSFVTLYHLVIEATLGLTGYEFITRYLRKQGLLPGFVEGYGRIHHDEQRHIGYGVWYLRETVGAHRALAADVRRTLGDVLPAVADALSPPSREGTDWQALGTSADEVRGYALDGLTRRLKIIGVEL